MLGHSARFDPPSSDSEDDIPLTDLFTYRLAKKRLRQASFFTSKQVEVEVSLHTYHPCVTSQVFKMQLTQFDLGRLPPSTTVARLKELCKRHVGKVTFYRRQKDDTPLDGNVALSDLVDGATPVTNLLEVRLFFVVEGDAATSLGVSEHA